jgi:uncharacterized protein (TIGR03085 family)
VTSLARRERLALCATALRVGPDAPTLCDPWSTRRLLAHLVVRERSVWALGIRVRALARLAEQSMDEWEGKDFEALVERFRSPGMTPLALPRVEGTVNTLEHLVHHEDIRRAQPGWEPRVLERADEATIWTMLTLFGRGTARRAGVPVRIEWDSRSATLRSGDDPVVLRGRPSELAILLSGRGRVARVDYAGRPEDVARVRGADFGV